LLLSDLPHRGHVDAELFIPIHSQQVIDQSLVVGCYGAGTGSYGFTCQVEVLADMAGIESDYLIGCFCIAPFCTFRNYCTDEGDRCLSDKT
jgi:hypothetical protein